MLKPEQVTKIQQEKLNALVAIQLHKKQISILQKINRISECLCIAVPAFYLTPRLLAKETSLEADINFFGEILAAILLILTIIKLVNKWQDNEFKHTSMSQRNDDIAYEADRLLGSTTASTEAVEQFLKRVQDVNAEDAALLINTKKDEKHTAYREALKKLGSSTPILCPICNSDPWKFTAGTCQACGGEPVTP
jgi:mobilome CxxCx(11)CxxC protein